MEEGLTPFVSPEQQEEEDVPLDFGEERVEIVTHIADSTTTKPKELTEKELQCAYGDLPKEQWASRAAVEQHFLAANPDQKHFDNFSGALPDPERAIVWGTNGEFSFAVQCLTREDSHPPSLSSKEEKSKKTEDKERGNGKGKEEDEDEDEDEGKEKEKGGKEEGAKKSLLEEALQESKSLAARNPAFGYKFATSLLECSAFVQTERHAIAQSRDPMHKMSEYKAIGKVDKTLIAGISELGPVLSQRLRENVNQKPKNKNYRAQPRPGNAVSQVEYASIELREETAEEFPTRKSAVNFRLMICKTPRAALSDEKRRSQWKDANLVFECAPGTIPCGAFNQQNLAVLYQPHVGKKGLLHLEFIELQSKSGKLVRTLKRRFYFPDGFAVGGMLCTAFNEQNVFAVSLGQNVLILDDETRTHLLTLSSRRITSLEFSSEGLLLLGSDAGECYIVQWSTGQLKGSVECTPAVEPVFSCATKNGITYLHSVMGLSVMQPDAPVFLELDRPLAFDVCGTLIFVMTKYGGLKIFKRDVRRVMHQCLPRPQKHRVNGVQHAYRGIKAYEQHVVCVYPDGVVRRFSLVTAASTK